MCISASMLMAIGSGVSALGSIAQGQQAKAMGNY